MPCSLDAALMHPIELRFWICASDCVEVLVWCIRLRRGSGFSWNGSFTSGGPYLGVSRGRSVHRHAVTGELAAPPRARFSSAVSCRPEPREYGRVVERVRSPRNILVDAHRDIRGSIHTSPRRMAGESAAASSNRVSSREFTRKSISVENVNRAIDVVLHGNHGSRSTGDRGQTVTYRHSRSPVRISPNCRARSRSSSSDSLSSSVVSVRTEDTDKLIDDIDLFDIRDLGELGEFEDELSPPALASRGRDESSISTPIPSENVTTAAPRGLEATSGGKPGNVITFLDQYC